MILWLLPLSVAVIGRHHIAQNESQFMSEKQKRRLYSDHLLRVVVVSLLTEVTGEVTGT